MTSANSSSVKRFISEQKAMTGRRLPLAALAVLMYFLYDVLGTALRIQQERSLLYLATEAAELNWPVKGAQIVSKWMGMRGIGPAFIGCVGAILLAIQGFSFLYRSQTADFYESRPEKRSTRFRNIVLNGAFIYMIPSLAGVFIAWLIALVNGCGAGWLLAEMLVSWAVQTVMFFAVYGMSITAALLTGTTVTAVLMNMYIFGIEALIRLTVYYHRYAYFATFDSSGPDTLSTFLTQPVYHYLYGLTDGYVFSGSDGQYVWADAVSYMRASVPGCLINAAIAAVFITAAFYLYRARKVEAAGTAVIYRPVALVIKFSAALLFSLCAGLFIHWIFESRNSAELSSVIAVIIIAVFVNCAVLEAVFGLNVRSAFRQIWQVPVIAAAALIILFIYRTDAFGYDRYVPAEDQIESAWLYNENITNTFYDGNGDITSDRDYIAEHMYLTDAADLTKLAAAGQKAAVTRTGRLPDAEDMIYSMNGWYAVLGWRLKNGRNVTRRIFIPGDTDPAMMDRIIANETYTDAVYQMHDGAELRRLAGYRNDNAELSIFCSTEHGMIPGGGELIDGFIEAYRQDLKEHYSFSMASGSQPEGEVEISTSGSYGTYGNYFGICYPVYEEYERTMSFLEEAGIWSGGFFEPDEIREAVVTVETLNEEDQLWEFDERHFKDADEIAQIMEASQSLTYTSEWIDYCSFFQGDERGNLLLEVYPKTAEDKECYDRRFLEGSVPDFVW